MDNNLFIVIPWPDIQVYMDFKGFRSNSILINDGPLYDEYGDSTYLVRKSWIDRITDYFESLQREEV
jgi:hypothetical protein